MTVSKATSHAREKLHLSWPVGARVAHTLTPLGTFVDGTVDRDKLVTPIIIDARDEYGVPAVGEVIIFRIVDPEETGAYFLMQDFPNPIYQSIGVTMSNGICMPQDLVYAGHKPGVFTIQAVARGIDGNDVTADFKITISEQIPTVIIPMLGGNQDFPAGSLESARVDVKVLDQDGKPVLFGGVYFTIFDPNNTGTYLTSASSVWVGILNGIASITWPMQVGENNHNYPVDFYLRASRLSAEYDFKYRIIAGG